MESDHKSAYAPPLSLPLLIQLPGMSENLSLPNYIQKPYRKPCEAFVISNALIITALHCLSTFRCEFAKAVIDRCAGRIRKCSVSTSQETVYFFVIYIIIIIESKIPTSHSVSSSTEEYHYSISFSRETSSHAQTPPHT